MQFTFDIPDAIAPRVINALCVVGGWTAESGMTKVQFAREMTRRWWAGQVRAAELEADMVTKSATIEAEMKTIT